MLDPLKKDRIHLANPGTRQFEDVAIVIRRISTGAIAPKESIDMAAGERPNLPVRQPTALGPAVPKEVQTVPAQQTPHSHPEQSWMLEG